MIPKKPTFPPNRSLLDMLFQKPRVQNTLFPKVEEELPLIYQRLVDKISKMSPEERFKTMVEAGIYTEDGELTEHYK